MLQNLLRASSILLLAPFATASTWVVDDTPGPGVHFSDISSAIAASSPGDVILVRAGNYAGFTLGIGVAILADPGANVFQPPATIHLASIPAGQRATLSGLYFVAMDVSACQGRVLIEGLTTSAFAGTVLVQDSVDVRLRDCDVSVDASTSRVEITGSGLRGRPGADGCEGTECQGPPFTIQGGPGQPAVLARDGAEVHVGASSIEGGRGGNGGYLDFQCPVGNGGHGGPAIRTLPGGVVFVTGTGNLSIRGGAGGLGALGFGCLDGANGPSGAAIDASAGTVLYSGMILDGAVLGAPTLVQPADPCLVATGSGVPGTPITYTVHGQPGDLARLRLGRQMIVEDLPFVFEDRLMVPLRSYLLGTLPASGQATFTLNVPGGLPPNFVLVAQASTTSPAGETRLTQSAPFFIR